MGLPRFHRDLDKASDFAPAGVMLDHTHERGDWTFLYRYQRVQKRGLLDDDVWVLPSTALQSYPTVPVAQTVESHLFGAMYAPHPRLTFAVLLPYVLKDTAFLGQGAGHVRTNGIGDAKLVFMLPFVQKGTQKTQFNLAVGFPTGSIEESAPDGQRLPYALQLGSGTYDIFWGLTYTGKHRRVSWGGQFEGIYRLGTNSVGYRLGSVYATSAWIGGSPAEWLSVSARLAYARINNIHGEDPTLDKTLNPMNDNKKYGGSHVFMGPGVNLLLPFLGGQRLAFEVLIPVYQSVDGPQLADDITYTAGWQWIF